MVHDKVNVCVLVVEDLSYDGFGINENVHGSIEKRREVIDMRVFIDFLVFVFTFIIFDWIIKKIRIHEKFFEKAIKVKHYNLILTCIFIIFMFLLEYGKYYLYELYGRRNWFSIAFAGILGSIYINYIPLMFKKK